jgi:mono/diheme cytochrome c family protein
LFQNAGGRAIHTPFGQVMAGNLTPDPATGLGAWSADAFWRAMHHGQSRDGRWLTPAFPFANTTHVTRTDSDALFAYLQSLPPVETPTPPHQLAWPYNTQAALKVWRALYFSPAEPQTTTVAANAEWARGAYLVQGLGHCGACHAERNALGATSAMAALGEAVAQALERLTGTESAALVAQRRDKFLAIGRTVAA